MFPAVTGSAVLLLMLAQIASGADTVAFPIKASANGRYLVDSSGRPFIYHADTAWTITRKLTAPEIDEYFDNCKAAGFTAVHVHTMSKEQGALANLAGDLPFDPDENILKPNEAYWKNVDLVIESARKRNLLVAISAIWIRWGGRDKEGWRYRLTSQNARLYGRFLGQRYKSFRNLMWIVGGDANPIERTEAVAEVARGIRELAPQQPISVHNRPLYSSAAFFDPEPWLTFNIAYTYEEVWPHVAGEYVRLGRKRPIFLGESGYEQESNDKRGGEPSRARRQAYVAILAGALGGHAYGHKSVWRFAPDWRDGLKAPGRTHMQHVKSLFTSHNWFMLEPDLFDELVTSGKGFAETPAYAAAARSSDGRLAIIYVPESQAITLDLARLSGPAKARWFDPTDGSYKSAESAPVPNSGRREFTPPGKNAAGDTDFVLVLEASGRK